MYMDLQISLTVLVQTTRLNSVMLSINLLWAHAPTINMEPMYERMTYEVRDNLCHKSVWDTNSLSMTHVGIRIP